MNHITTGDGRILTPPKELKLLLKGAFPAFFSLLGHIRFFYVADEIWDGNNTLIFKKDNEQLVKIVIGDNVIHAFIDDMTFRIVDESTLNDIYMTLKGISTVNQRRPIEQLTADLCKYPSGIRCDLCLCHTTNNDTEKLSGVR